MIQGRYVTKGYALFVKQSFLRGHADEIKRSAGFVGIDEGDDAPIVSNRSKLRGFASIWFASKLEAELFANTHGADVYVGSYKDGVRMQAVEFSGENAVFGDWYSNDDWRAWWNSKPSETLDRVNIKTDDFIKICSAYDEAEKDFKGVLSNLVLKEIPLRRFSFPEGDCIYEFDYKGNGVMRVNSFIRHQDGTLRPFLEMEIHGMESELDADFGQESIHCSPFMAAKAPREVAYKAAWDFVIVNWFMLNLPARVSKQRKAVGHKRSKKRKHSQKPLEVIWRDEYEIDINGLTKTMIRREIRCLCWGVRGHERHYKNGRVVFIKPYRKGKERDNPDAYVAKTYRKEGDEE